MPGALARVVPPLLRLARVARTFATTPAGRGTVHVWPLLPIPEGRAARRVVVAGPTDRPHPSS